MSELKGNRSQELSAKDRIAEYLGNTILFNKENLRGCKFIENLINTIKNADKPNFIMLCNPINKVVYLPQNQY